MARTAPTTDAAQPSRREAVYDAALSLFAERGYRATTMRDIGEVLRIRGPSLYNHIVSKHELLATIMADFIDLGLAAQKRVLAASDDPVDRLRGLVDAHVRLHTRHRREAFIGNRELASLSDAARAEVVSKRARYASNLLGVIEQGIEQQRFSVPAPRLAAYAILDMGIGLSTWFRPDGPSTEDEVSEEYQEFALRLVGLGG
jgi:AcrR family transcriptional regulator